jgi:ATP:ADP antiporter, AAA family
VQSWTLISQRLLARQARRSLGLIGSGAIIGGMAGGLFARWGAEYWGVSMLLPISAILILMALVLSQIPTFSAPIQNTPIIRTSEAPKLRKQFVNLTLIVVGCVTVVSTFADFQFKAISQREFVTAEKLAVFFGSFYAYFGAATLAFQLICTPALMRWVALPITLAILPSALLMGNAFLYIAGSLAGVVFLKGSEQLFRNSVDRSSMEVLFLAIPESSRVRIQSLVSTVGVRVSEAIGAVLLTLFFSLGNFPLSVSAFAGMLFSTIAIGTIVLLAREYARALRGSIHKKETQFSMVRSGIFTTDFYKLLPEVLQNSKKEVILDLLEVLSERKIHTPHLEILLTHKEADVRLKALELLFSRKEDVTAKVDPLLSDADRRVRLEALHYLSWRSSRDLRQLLSEMKGESDQALQIAVSLLQSEHQQELIGQFMKSEEVELRFEVINILGDLRPNVAAEEVYKKLLLDPSEEIRKAVLVSIGRTTPAGLVPVLIDGMIASPMVIEFRTALEKYGEALLPELKKMLEDKKKTRDQKKVIVKIADTVGGRQASEMLVNTARGADLVLRFAAIKAMNQLKRRRALELPAESLESLLDQEIEALNVEYQRMQFIQPEPGGLAERVLKQRQDWAKERIFRVLGLLYDSRSMYYAYLALQSNQPRRIDSALELLDTLLRSEHRRRILALVESPEQDSKVRYHPEAKKSMLLGYIGAGDQLPAAALIAELSNKELDTWKSELASTIEVFSNVSLVRETLTWRYSEQMEDQSKGQRAFRALTTVQKLESLSKVDIFSALGPHELLLLANQSVEVEFEPGQIILKEGERPSYIFSLISGEAERYRSSGRLDSIHAGESFGTLPALTNKPHFYSARALEHCFCLKLDQESFLEVMEDQPAIAFGIFQVLNQKMMTLITQLERLEEELARHGEVLKRPS